MELLDIFILSWFKANGSKTTLQFNTVSVVSHLLQQSSNKGKHRQHQPTSPSTAFMVCSKEIQHLEHKIYYVQQLLFPTGMFNGTYKMGCSSTRTSRRHWSLALLISCIPPLSHHIGTICVADAELPVANKIKVLGVVLDRHRRLSINTFWQWPGRAIFMHKPSTIYVTYCQPTWHTYWPAVISWWDWTTATWYSMARQSPASRSCSVCRIMQPESSSRHWGGPMPNRWCVDYTGCRFNTELTTRCLCWHTRLGTCLYHGTSANTSTAASTHGHYARRLRHCSSNHSFAPTSRNVLFDAPYRLSGTHFLRLSSEATHSVFKSWLKTFLFH